MALPVDAGAGMVLPPPDPITPRQAVDDVLLILMQIRHKLKTMIDWYIYPEIIPNEIQAYDPRLVILQQRLRSMATLSYPQLPYLIDNSDVIAAQYLTVIVSQLLNSVHGIQKIFMNHYDRDLEDSRPFATIWETLNYRIEQLNQIPNLNPNNPRRLRPEDLRANELGNFCRGALQISNNRDKGRLSFVDKKDLLDEERRKLKAFGGAFLNWECPECAYKVRYHVASSVTSNIHSTDEIREHDGVAVQYRSSFAAKCHLYLPLSEKAKASMSTSSTNTRRDSNILGAVVKYGCVFCFARGRQLERGDSAFTTARDLVEHIDHEHRNPLPPSMMLHRFLVAVEGKTHDEWKRWDLNFV
ncbi:hypothetical protein A1O3_07142 [Capronia epimyces CBS 606.96]|uniref:C2H2-type domain-containing protein n=1 Tax=Capronia epimyces CBS 606.96 TaxID=1182542 RepID=W9XV60_9EURO|nr:uncharacterized protein A1O3_07142 [Capronia epimyces CBS 606.96]EXJ80856.1 hypothetical protein A1O3_07142 [Capronia epimyces CBS 606.96]